MPTFHPLLVVPVVIPWQLWLFFFVAVALWVLKEILLPMLFGPGRQVRSKSIDLPDGTFEVVPSLLTDGEQAFFPALERAAGLASASVGEQFRVMVKVRLGDLIEVNGNGDRSVGQSASGRTRSKHVDFVLCSSASIQPLLVIELDDKSHDAADRRERDAFVDDCLADAGLPILHVPCQRAYDAKKLAADIKSRIRQ